MKGEQVNPTIEARNIHKSFGNNHVLQGIDLSVERGEVVAIIGPSGSGKSTLLRCLNLLERPERGTIRIGEVSVDTKNLKKPEIQALRQQTAMVFQNYNLFRNRRVLENLTDVLDERQNIKGQPAIEQALELLKSVGLEGDITRQYPITLSGGQQQRVSIARALAAGPEALLFDEPTSALDPELVGGVLNVIASLTKQHMTLAIVTHELSFALEVADRVIFMDGGVIVEQGTAQDVLTNPQHDRTKQFLSTFTGFSPQNLESFDPQI